MTVRLLSPSRGISHTFGGRTPVATIHPGEVVTVSTLDCFGGRVTSADTLPSQVCDLSTVNPVTGPFHIEGARPGDTLAVHLISIKPTFDWGVSATFPHFGTLTTSHETALLHPPLQERVWRYPLNLEAGTATFEAPGSPLRIEIPMRPMHGTIGVAPSGGQAITTLTSGPHGGNLDTAEIVAGTTVYLGVNVHGAMLALGDGHAVQGDGEICGVGVECAMTTTLVVDVVPGVSTAWPRLETDSHLMSVGAGRPLEDAFRIAHTDMVGWLGHLTGLDQLDALQLLSQAGGCRIGNVCDPAYTALALFGKRLLPSTLPSAYGGIHQQLRAAAVPES